MLHNITNCEFCNSIRTAFTFNISLNLNATESPSEFWFLMLFILYFTMPLNFLESSVTDESVADETRVCRTKSLAVYLC